MPQVGSPGAVACSPEPPLLRVRRNPKIPSAWRGGLVAGLRVWAGQLGLVAVAAPGAP